MIFLKKNKYFFSYVFIPEKLKAIKIINTDKTFHDFIEIKIQKISI
jgi:hypothetical protein